MASLGVVPVEEAVEAAGAQAVGCPGPGIGPNVEKASVEPFCFAVGPGAAGLFSPMRPVDCGVARLARLRSASLTGRRTR